MFLSRPGQGLARLLPFWYIYCICTYLYCFNFWLLYCKCIIKQKQLPAIETVLKATSSNINQRVPPIVVLILCPTRELAIQIAAETNVLLKYHDGIGVQTLIGGTRFKLDQKRLESNPCQVQLICMRYFIPALAQNMRFLMYRYV